MLLYPDWQTPANVIAAMSTRLGGVSIAPYDSLNLGYATADQRDHVLENERIVAQGLGVQTDALRWVYQVHGNVVHHAETLPVNAPLGATLIEGDAIVSHTRGLVCGVKVADCMPVLLAADDSSVVGAAHAGWRGLSTGVIENTIHEMRTSPESLQVWLGPCIGAAKFEVGEDVRVAFLDGATKATRAVVEQSFVALPTPGKYLCDLRAIAATRLHALGVQRIYASTACTMTDTNHFFSHRRDRLTGRMAAFIGLL